MQKIIVTDFDKTFYLNEIDLEKNKNAVKQWQEADNLFVIATGRSFLDLMEDTKKHHINFDYALINHGATIIDSNCQVLFNFPMSDSIVTSLMSDLELEQSSYHFCCSKLASRVDLSHPNISKIGIDYIDTFDINTLNDKINSHYPVNSYLVGKHALEIITDATDKAASIKVLAQYLNINESLIYTIGDSYNDIKMVENYHGFCMTNSIEKLKMCAQKQYSSVSDLIFELLEK